MGVNILDLEARVSADTRDFERGMDKVGRESDQASGKARKGFGLIAGAGLGAVGALAGAGAAIGSATMAASNLNEAVNVTGLIFKDSAKEIGEFAKGAAAIGMTETQAREATGTFGGLLQNMGLNRKETLNWSKDLTVLASDMGSAFNEEPAEVVQAIGAALRGETESIRRFNVMLSDQDVRQKAVEMGLAASTKEVDKAGKAQATLALIMGQTAAVQGDFANTSDGAANAQRILKAEMGNLMADLGGAFLPLFGQALALLKDIVPEVREVAENFLKRMGPAFQQVGSIVKENFPLVRSLFMGIVDVVRQYVLPVVAELFNVWKATWVGIIGAIRENEPSLRNIFELIQTLVRAASDVFRTILLPIIKLVFVEVLPVAIGVALKALGLIAPVITAVITKFTTMKEDVTENVGALRDFISGAVGAITGFFTGMGVRIREGVAGILGFFGPEGDFRKPFRQARDFVGGTIDDVVSFYTGLPGRIADGVRAGANAVKQAITDLFGALPGWAKKILGISSPSKVFEEIGQNVVQGFIGGMGGMAGELKDRALGMAKEALGSLGGLLGGIKGKLGFGKGGGGGSILDQLIGFANAAGITVTSTTGGRHAKGSYHYQGRAIDVAGSHSQMMSFFQAAVSTFGDAIRELFYDPMGYYIKNGQIVGGAIGGHGDHAHLALGSGGIVLPQMGGVPAILAERNRPEAVIPLDSPRARGMLGNNMPPIVITGNTFLTGERETLRALAELLDPYLEEAKTFG